MTASPYKLPFIVLLIGSVLLISGAWFTQYVLGWEPCPMCLWQRQPHYLIFALAVVAFGGAAIGGLKKYLFGVAFGIALIAYGFAIYRAGFHFGVEQLWWEGWHACGGSKGAISAMDLLAKPSRDCAIPTYIFPYVSMALGHLLALIDIVLLAAYAWYKTR